MKATLVLCDGDRVEPKNLNRQHFRAADVGTSKPEALASYLKAQYPKLSVTPISSYLTEELADYAISEEMLGLPMTLFMCVDNHPSRITGLNLADKYGAPCYLAGNEYWSAEAYLYQPVWKDSPADPRLIYPELLEETSGDPTTASCTGDATDDNPQLITANIQAASYLLQLFSFWSLQAPELDTETEAFWPIHYSVNAGKIITWKLGDRCPST